MEPLQRLLNALKQNGAHQLSDEVIHDVTSDVELTGNLTQALVSIAKLPIEDIIQFYSTVLELQIMNGEELALYPVDREMGLKFSKYHHVVPLDFMGDELRIATSSPYDTYPIHAVKLASEKRVSVCLALPADIERALDIASSDEASISELSEQLENEDISGEESDINKLKDLASEAPIVRMVNVLVAKAMELRASDIHIEPFEQRLRVRYRIDGVLREMDSPPVHSTAAIISRIKIMAKLNIAERRLPQDGRTQMRLQGRHLDLRISTIPSLFGESVVIRILDKEQLNLSFDKLGFGNDNTERFQQLIGRPNGIILVTGPTGSGKTTTLYTALAGLNLPDKKIMTVEDPIEYQLDGIMQMQVKPEIGLNFADALRAIVRQDPDTIMIGEMRDYVTASIAIQSALTGHLAQRLVRTLCNVCKKEVTPLSDVIVEFGLENYQDEPTLYEPVGCVECNGTGYKGRTVILEQMNIDDSLRKEIMAHVDGVSIQNHALKNGMQGMREDGIRKAVAGVTTLAEVIKATQDL